MIGRLQTTGRHAEWVVTRRHADGAYYLAVLPLQENKIDALGKFGIRITDKLVKAAGKTIPRPENQVPGIQIKVAGDDFNLILVEEIPVKFATVCRLCRMCAKEHQAGCRNDKDIPANHI